VKQSEARAAEEREAQRIAEQMKEAGLDPPAVDVAGLSRTIYSGSARATTADHARCHDPRPVGALAVDPQRVEARYAGTRIELA
jgi:hypothetical protein